MVDLRSSANGRLGVIGREWLGACKREELAVLASQRGCG